MIPTPIATHAATSCTTVVAVDSHVPNATPDTPVMDEAKNISLRISCTPLDFKVKEVVPLVVCGLAVMVPVSTPSYVYPLCLAECYE